MTAEISIRGGIVVDGTGSPPVQADVGITDGKVVEIGDSVRGERQIDASGRLVVPGFIDIHTHYDPQVLWDPWLTPSSWHGVTTVVAGNCGYSIAPTRAAEPGLDPAHPRQGRGHAVVDARGRGGMGLRDLPGVSADRRPARHGDQLRRLCRAHPGAALRHGGRGLRAGGHGRRDRPHAPGRQGVARRGRPRLLERPRRLPSGRWWPPGAVDRLDPGRARSPHGRHRRDRSGHGARRPGRALLLGLRLPAAARPHDHLVGDPHLPRGHRLHGSLPRQAAAPRRGTAGGRRRLGPGDLPADHPVGVDHGADVAVRPARIRRPGRHPLRGSPPRLRRSGRGGPRSGPSSTAARSSIPGGARSW